jgi:hypothetical protein
LILPPQCLFANSFPRTTRTKDCYVDWNRRYILFHQQRQPAALGATAVTRF